MRRSGAGSIETGRKTPADQLSRFPLRRAARSAAHRTRSSGECVEELGRLCRQVLEERDDRYLSLRARPNALRRQVDAFGLYRDFLPEEGTVLDWGCKHAPDSCLLRFELGDRVRLLGYDFDRADVFAAFHDYAGLEFTPASHPYLLPYEDESVDAVVASGVLEHVAIPAESLKEIYRITRPGGVLAITFLPNRWSWSDALLRLVGSPFYHRRRYSRGRVRRLLLDHGFEPQRLGYHQFVPAQRGGRLAARLWSLNRPLERLWPLRLLCANLYVVAIKRPVI